MEAVPKDREAEHMEDAVVEVETAAEDVDHLLRQQQIYLQPVARSPHSLVEEKKHRDTPTFQQLESLFLVWF